TEQSKSEKRKYEVRIFNNNWTLSYLFTDLNGKPLCLVCGITIAVMKEFNLRRHYDSHHKEKFEKFEGQARNEEVKKLMLQLKKQQSCFVKPQQIRDGAVKASYVIANEIAIASKPFTEGEFVKKCILLAAENICPEKRSDLNSISLSRNTVAERISELATDLDNQLKEKVKQFVAVSLAIFIRGVNASLDITEEFLQLVPLLNTTTSDDIFCAVQDALDKIGLDWSRVVSLATDGAPAMIGKKSGAATKI
uniref:SPIN-DOC-like zinc-finger domain-containing protein n=1 Tax=Anopheles atroparvus TaxID=41427 RepID=A0AAG5DR17_ANOAO